MRIRIVIGLLLVAWNGRAIAQVDSTQVNSKRLKWFIGSSSVAYVGSLVALNELWYKDFPREGFHFFDDSKEWKQMDKVGHMYSSYHISKLGYTSLRWSGLSDKKSYIYGGLIGVVFMTPIEIMDGYSAEYGASASDIVANLAGAGLFTIQGLVWNEERIKPKFSFDRSGLAPLRPNTLGRSFNEEVLKDYNAQTYWLSVDLYSFNDRIPKWLNIAAGYGAHNMIYANDLSNESNGYNSYRQYYLGIDLDLSHFQSKSKLINTLLYIGDMIKIPAPALEYNKENNFTFHWLAY